MEEEKPPENTPSDRTVFDSQDVPKQIPELSEVDLLSAKVVELETALNQYKDQLLRKAAEFENYKKRTESDYAALVRYANEDLVGKLLPVLDDFERSLKAIKKTEAAGGSNEKNNVFGQALELIYNKLGKILESQGLTHFEVVGQPFDPQLHDALMQMPKSGVPPHTVIEEVEKGYMLGEKVLRHARVIVSSESSDGK